MPRHHPGSYSAVSDDSDDDLLALPGDKPRASSPVARPRRLSPPTSKPPEVPKSPTASPTTSPRSGPAIQIPTRRTTYQGKGPLVIGIDYGTTGTAIAFAQGADNIEVIQNWGDGVNVAKVRSAISYINPKQGEIEWGPHIKDKRVAMVNTKLELEPQKSKLDELDLTLHVLRGLGFPSFEEMKRQGPVPQYPSKPPAEIIKDYLEKVFKRTRAEIGDSFISGLKTTQTPVDIVMTIPVEWSYEAKSSIFKAVRQAGFNKESFPTLRDTIMISEPEAASYFTAQDLRDSGKECFEEGDCFVLCDAGGGTVDTVAFQVVKLKPDLVLKRITKPKGGKFGSALIDTEFKGWLRDTIEETHYAEIDRENARQHRISPNASETGPMRELIKRFNAEKHVFSNDEGVDREIVVDLPEPLDKLSIADRSNEGALTISREEMKELMNKCVDGALSLIIDQINLVYDEDHGRVWSVLLVGGFGSSPYLREELQKNLEELYPHIGVYTPKDANQSTAVVKGAVIYGREKARYKDVTYLSAISTSYGVVINGKFVWLIRRGDMACSNEEIKLSTKQFWQAVEPTQGQQYTFAIYGYISRGDDYVPATWREGQRSVKVVAEVKCDLSKDLTPAQRTRTHSRVSLTNGVDRVGPWQWKLKLTATNVLEAEILYGDKGLRLGHTKFNIDVDPPVQRRTLSSAMSALSVDD